MFDLNKIVASFLEKRNISISDVETLIQPSKDHQHDPVLLNGVTSWSALLHQCKGLNITIVPDYDADGILSGTLARVGLYMLGFGDVNVYPPKSYHGYGMTETTVDEVLRLYPTTQVIVTTDNGSNALTGVSYAKSKGLVVLVTDHHIAQEDVQADAEINPNHVDDETYPYKSISGTTVIYKGLLHYAHQYGTHDDVRQLHNLIFLVGVSVISDVMPIVDENRYYVTEAVRMFTHFYQNFNDDMIYFYDDTPIGQYYRGLGLLVIELNKHGRLKYGINTDTFGFTIGPILNAPRRMLGDSTLGFALFHQTLGHLQQESYIPPSVALHQVNEQRKAYVTRYTKSLFDTIEQSGLSVVDFSVCHTSAGGGIAGLLANQYTKRYGLPSIVFSTPERHIVQDINSDIEHADTLMSGSARSPEWFNMHGFLTKLERDNPSLIHGWGGHAQAAGVSVYGYNYQLFHKLFTEALRQEIEGIMAEKNKQGIDEIASMMNGVDFVIDTLELSDKHKQSFNHVVTYDGELHEAIYQFEDLAPFGVGFREPIFGMVFSTQGLDVFKMGQEKQHVRIRLFSGLTVIGWNMADLFDDTDKTEYVTTGIININRYNGREYIQYIIQDVL